MARNFIEIPLISCGMILVCIGVGIMVFFSYYQLHNTEIIGISYNEEICSCRSSCNVYKLNGCTQFCRNELNHYIKRRTFNCLSMNVMVTIKNVNGNHTCEFNGIEKGFYYPSMNLKWTNPEYSNYYKSYDYGDNIHIYYNKDTDDCITKSIYNGDFSAGIICLSIGGFFLFIYSRMRYRKYIKKQTKVVNFIHNNIHVIDMQGIK